ncbi:MAG: hypothetical protein QOF77_1418 [Solirubrobacteraceae bacterium]|jgi:hypothetical protein|nr:hypothetical protein [Solirubrobacteraceae bacterium]
MTLLTQLMAAERQRELILLAATRPPRPARRRRPWRRRPAPGEPRLAPCRLES